MNMFLYISSYCYRLNPNPYQRIYVSNVCVLDVVKVHSHRYDLQAFFYRDIYIFSLTSFSTKKKLYDAIQKLLQEHL